VPCVELAPFFGDRRIALTTSWDDGRVYDRRLVAAFNEWGLKGTFNPSALQVTLRVGKQRVEVPAGQTIPLPAY
jgi:hypothetical protein